MVRIYNNTEDNNGQDNKCYESKPIKCKLFYFVKTG